MAEINDWDVTDANNNLTPPEGWPENMNYSEVNDSGRAVQGKVKRWFADINGSLACAGLVNAYTVTLNAGYTAYFDGLFFVASISITNTGASTINVNSIGVKTIKDKAGNALQGGELEAGGMYSFFYDGTDIRVLNVFANWPDIRLDTAAGQRVVRSENPAGTSQFALLFESNGDFGLYDATNTRYVGYYDESTNNFNLTTDTVTKSSVPIYGLTLIDDPPVLLSTGVAGATWTLLDMSAVYAAAATAGAKGGKLLISGFYSSVGVSEFRVSLRKTGSGVTTLNPHARCEGGNTAGCYFSTTTEVEFDAASDFDYYIVSTAGSYSLSMTIQLVGYYT